MISGNVESGGQTHVSTEHLQQVHAQIFVRHGARTPIKIIPNVESAIWDKDELFSGAENTHIEYEVKSINGGPAPFWTAEAGYRTQVLQSHDLPIPEVLKPYLDCIERHTLELTKIAMMGIKGDENNETLKMNAGTLVPLVVQNLRDAAQEKGIDLWKWRAGIKYGYNHYKPTNAIFFHFSGCKFHLYACHDLSIIILLSALNIFDNQWLSFAADLRFEVYKNTIGQHFVKISYVGKVLKVPGEPCLIPLESLVSKMSTIATEM
ncbi:lysophosphatidic acid phosphatase type 6-like [Saccoglossus kowalevskii]